ncbi:hypothetical protein [Actimicrobium sp. CCI2.3]|uniref:hypothetical protein n=1 Tax=Actimicrobium sp. CCI2.3 TaxID=3048616 RepID=UPI002AB376E3|nr:hypothetical protein [Actimicrobium sp. CCI2.3]MDY7575762.1 hypothetical protein [Actimicrobium sp. CCI2.3]MEB0023710.1 hypothetical protein [Actimicrobium sp. CCI2.3]
MTTDSPSKTPVKKPVPHAAAKAKPAATTSVKPAVAAKPPAVRTSRAKPAVVAPAARSKLPAKSTAKLPVKAAASPAIAFPKSSPAPVVIAEVKEKVKKAKLIRDSFTMPEIEYAVLGEVKKNCLKAGFDVKKSELLRIGVVLIRDLDLATLKGAVAALSPLKPGRPRKEK